MRHVKAKSESRFQDEAADAIFVETGDIVGRYEWLTSNCGVNLCITPEHLDRHAARKLYYPHGVCIYCGDHAFTVDHIIPVTWSGQSARHYVATVPCCGTCNSLLGDVCTETITERRAVAHLRLRRKYAKCLRVRDFTQQELAEFEGFLRDDVILSIEKKARVLAMLSWPDDPFYDLRALEQSGIDDPYAAGLLEPQDEAFITRMAGKL